MKSFFQKLVSHPISKKRDFYNKCAIQSFDFRSVAVKSKNAEFSGDITIIWQEN